MIENVKSSLYKLGLINTIKANYTCKRVIICLVRLFIVVCNIYALIEERPCYTGRASLLKVHF